MMDFCIKHRKRYFDLLHMCPMCRKDFFATLPRTPLGPSNIPDEYVPNKRGLYLNTGEEVATGKDAVSPPVQMALF